MRNVLVLLLWACACRIGFDEVSTSADPGDVICLDELCYCEPGTSCAFACNSPLACSIDCTDAMFCAVDCGPAAYCVVECPEAGCEVTGCGAGCTVVCGETALASRSGGEASCP